MYLATVLLEPNRWKRDRPPLLRWEDGWAEKLAASGFTGLELWDGHFPGDQVPPGLLCEGPCPVRIFSWYGIPGDGTEGLLLHAVESLKPCLEGVKFNVGRDRGRLVLEARAVAELAAKLGSGIRLICECHSGTSLEDPRVAAGVFADWPENVVAAVHPFSGGAADWLDHLGSRITHLHLQSRDGESWTDPVPGGPGVDEGLALLAKRKFAGTASLEFVRGVTGGLAPDELLARAVAVRAQLDPFIIPFLKNS